MYLTAVLALCAAPLQAHAHGGGRGMAGGGPGGLALPDLPAAARGPMNFPERARNPRDEVAAAASERGSSVAAEARRAHARELWRANRALLDFDSRRQLIVRGEIVAFGAASAALAQAQARGFVIRRQEALDGLDATVTVLAVPQGQSLRRALRRLRAADPVGRYDYNHIYFESGAAAVATRELAGSLAAEAPPASGRARRIGLIDGGVAAGHPALRSVAVRTRGCSSAPVPSAHGTAVASLLAGAGDATSGAVRHTEIFAADVYCGAPAGGATDALLEALGWLVRERVPVINVSLVGPPNSLLERAIDLATERGYLIVAAVGNDGPAAPPLYPAGYARVVAVTGVDRSEKVLLEAGRGTHVDFAAPGADLLAASLPQGRAEVRGTSFAAPIVAGLLAARLDRPDPLMAQQAVRQLAAAAVDLGARGYDPVYGNGLVGGDMLTTPAAMAQSD